MKSLTLGGLIQALAKIPAGIPIAEGCVGVCSYRGNYSDLAVYAEGPSQHDGTVGGFLALLQRTRNSELTGYKGGQFLMTDDTVVFGVWGTDSHDSHPIRDVSVVTSAITDTSKVVLV